MASDPHVQRPKVPRRSVPPGHKRLQNAYIPEAVGFGVISGLVHSGLACDLITAWVAERQWGLITAAQLHRAGVGRGSIEWRLAHGLLHRVFRGVYLVGHRVPVAGAVEFAAVLAVGDGSLVSHRSAAAILGLAGRPAVEVEVTVIQRDCRSRDGLRVHQVQQLSATDRADKAGIPITTPARTVIDFASTAVAAEAERAIAEAFALKLVTEMEISAAAERDPRRAGVAQVRAILGQAGGPKRTRSGGERAMLRLVRAARLPMPRTNYTVAGFSADFCWPEQRLIVEVDGYDFHSNRTAFERDHRRDIVHKSAGYEVLRFTARQLAEEPLYVAAVIASALDRRSRG